MTKKEFGQQAIVKAWLAMSAVSGDSNFYQKPEGMESVEIPAEFLSVFGTDKNNGFWVGYDSGNGRIPMKWFPEKAEATKYLKTLSGALEMSICVASRSYEKVAEGTVAVRVRKEFIEMPISQQYLEFMKSRPSNSWKNSKELLAEIESNATISA